MEGDGEEGGDLRGTASGWWGGVRPRLPQVTRASGGGLEAMSFIHRKLLQKGGEWGKGGGTWELTVRVSGSKSGLVWKPQSPTPEESVDPTPLIYGGEVEAQRGSTCPRPC